MCCYPYYENGLIKELVLDYVYGHYGSEVVELMEKDFSSCVETAREMIFL